MAWLFLGLVSLPFAAVLYVLTQRLGPRLLEAVPETPLAGAGEVPARGARRRIQARQLMGLRAGAAVALLALVAIGVNRGVRTTPNPKVVAPAGEVQLPSPIALKVQARFGADGTGSTQLHDPRDIAVDPAGNVYVADTGNKRVLKFSPTGSPAGAWTDIFTEPSSLAAVKDGLVVDDSETGRLRKFGFDGNPVPGFEHNLGLSHPRGIAAGPDGTIYVADTANNRILMVGPDGMPRGAFDTKGAQLEQPTGVAVDEQGSIYSIEPAASRIQKFAPDGALQAHLYLPSAVTVFPPRAIWIPGHGLTVTLPDQNELLTYGPAGVPQATFVPEAPAPLRPLGLALAHDGKSVWVVWNNSASATLLLWP